MRVSLCQRDIRAGMAVKPDDMTGFTWFMIDLLAKSHRYNGSDEIYLSKMVDKFMGLYPREIISANHSGWNMGNILHYLVTIYLQPDWLGVPAFSELQNRDALFVLYKLIVVYGVPLDEQDDSNRTPLQLAEQLKISSNVEQFEELRYLMNNAQAIKFRQLFLIKRFLLHKRRKHAANVICERVLHHVLNPDTKVGMRMLMKRAEQFKMIACT